MSEANFENRTLYQGDNLEFLRGMNSESVHLIATDPPFNKSRDFHATPDSLASGASFTDRWRWEDDVQQEWVDQIVDDWPGVWRVIEAAREASGRDMAAFLCWLGVRLMEMHRILREDGSLYLHIDDTAQAWTKAMMDGIFGRSRYKNEIIWKRSGGKSDARKWGRVHDTLLFYTKDAKRFTWNQQFQPLEADYVSKTYRHDDDDGRGNYTTMPLHAAGESGGQSGEAWQGYDPNAMGNHWRTPTKGVMAAYIQERGLIPGWPHSFPTVHERLEALDRAGLIAWSDNRVPRLKVYLASTRGRAATDIIADVPMASGRERTGYPTQKPVALYERIIKASSNAGDIVLDPFAGCATTCVAAERLGRRWVGMDIWNQAHDTVVKRLLDEGLASEDYDPKQPHLLVAGEAPLARRPPERTDAGNVAAPEFRLQPQRAVEPWQGLAHKQMRAILAQAQAMEIEHRFPQAQAAGELVGCAGCGRTLEDAFMQLDHIMPKADNGDNFITNRILLCGPCNGRKSSELTLNGLVRANNRDGWMRDRKVARKVTSRARLQAERVRDNWGREEIQRLVEWAKGN